MQAVTKFNGNSTMLCSRRQRMSLPAFFLALYLWPHYYFAFSLSHSGKDFMLEAVDVLKGVGSSFPMNIYFDTYRSAGACL